MRKCICINSSDKDVFDVYAFSVKVGDIYKYHIQKSQMFFDYYCIYDSRVPEMHIFEYTKERFDEMFMDLSKYRSEQINTILK
jgi:hypothetical protein